MTIKITLAALTLTMLAMFGDDKPPVLKIVQDRLLQRNNLYYVKGSIYNPSDRAVKNVVIRYYIWEKWKGKDGHGSIIKETSGLVEARIKYMPPKQTVDFEATSDNAGVMMHDSPDPIEARITAEWDN